MTLRVRWTLALVAVCLVQAGLVATIVSVQANAALDQFVYEQTLRDFTDDVERYARENGSIEGFQTTRIEGRPPARGPGARAEGAPPPNPQLGADSRPPPRRRDGPPARQPEGQRSPPPLPEVRWGLADASGRTVIRTRRQPVGTLLPADQLEAGTPVVVDGTVIGTVLPPVTLPDGFGFGPDSPGSHYVAATRSAFLWGLALALVLAMGLGIVLASRAVRPLQDLTDAAARVADGDRSARVEVRSADEVGQLAAAFNAMSARLAESNALRERMTADISHDLRTPLTAIMGTLEAMQDGSLPATSERLGSALGEALRMSRLVDDLHTLALADARELSIHLAPVEPRMALDHVARLYEAASLEAGIELAVESESVPTMQADPDRLVQVLGNLVGNAIRHTPEGGHITLRARAEGHGIELAVEDTGEGIPPDVLPIVFERSVRADAARSGPGSGLGLSIVRSLVAAMGGRVAATSSMGEGTTMTVWLPRVAESA